MKVQKAAIKSDDFRVWCTGCSIRIAPHEEQISADGQTYHPRCYSKHLRAAKDKATRQLHPDCELQTAPEDKRD